MNFKQANAVSILALLGRLNIKPVKIRRYEARFLSPFRREKTASLDVNFKTNEWYDHGIGKGGGCVKFVCELLDSQNEDHTNADAIRWIANMSGQSPLIMPIEHIEPTDDEKLDTLVISGVKAIQERTLGQYLASRGIPLKLAQKYLKEVRVYNRKNKKHFYALGFQNEDENFELRNKYFKGCIDSKNITFIRGKNPNSKGIHIFEGFMDFLTAALNEKDWEFQDDVIVLNSLSCLTLVTPYIANFGYKMAYTWLDNDAAGKQATKLLNAFFKTEIELLHRPMNNTYLPHKDVNEHHMHKLGLALV